MLTLHTLGTFAGVVAAVTAATAVGRRVWAGFASPLSIMLMAEVVVIADGLATERLSFVDGMLWVINGIVVAAAVLGVRNGAALWMPKPQ